jgi:glutathione S-transferase
VRNKVFLREKGDQDAIARGETRLRELGPILEDGLRTDDFLTGAAPTIADLSVGSNLFQLGFADAIPPGARIAAWYGRIGQLEAFRKSLPRN